MTDATSDIHILTVDYRGYGLSTGVPDENGVIVDAITTIKWAMEVAQIPASRIAILGHSLGTAIAIAAVDHFAQQGIEFAGTVLVAPFSNLANVFGSYTIAGQIPLLLPLTLYPAAHKWFLASLAGQWASSDRLASFVRASKKVQLFLIHSKNDGTIPWHHTEALFVSAVNATVPGGMELDLLHKMKARSTVKIGDGFRTIWKASPEIVITEEVVVYGRKL